MSCDKNKVFYVDNLFNELQTANDKRIARLNLGIKDSDSLTWGNIGGNIHDQADLVAFTETVKALSSQTGTVIIFRLNNINIDRSVQDIPEGWSLTMPDTTNQDILYLSQATKQGGLYQVHEDGTVWSAPIQINYSNVTDSSQQEQIDELLARLNESITSQTYLENLVQTMNQVTVNPDGSISVTGRDGQVSVWQHQDLGDYLLLGNRYGDDESFFILRKDGTLFANNAVIYGTVYATDGYFAGELRSATGSFTGEINATSGNIGGWEIKNGVLKPKNVPTSSLIGTIEASQINFGNTLTTLQNNIQRDYTSAIKNIKTTILNTISSLDTKLLNKESFLNSEIAKILTANGILEEDIDKLTADLLAEIQNRIAAYNNLDSKIDTKATELSSELDGKISDILEAYLHNLVTQSELETRLTLVSGEIAGKVSKTDFNLYGEAIARQLAELAITHDQIQSIVQSELANYRPGGYVTTTEWASKIQQLATSINSKVSTSTYNSDKELIDSRFTEINQTASNISLSVQENQSLLASLGISNKGIQMVGNTLSYSAPTDPKHPVFICNADGSGYLAKGNIAWDSTGDVLLGSGVTISWNNITGKPTEFEDVDIVNYYDTKEYYYLASTSDERDLPLHNNEAVIEQYWSETCDVLTPGKRYLWVIRLIYVELNGEVTLHKITDPQLIYVKEAPGNYITDIQYKYYANKGANVSSSVEGYSTIEETGFGPSNPYLWNKVIFIDQDGDALPNAEWQLLSYWAKDGETFEVADTTTEYIMDNTGNVPLTSDIRWSTTQPVLQKGYFLYTKTTTTYTNGATTYVISTSYIANDGDALSVSDLKTVYVRKSTQTTPDAPSSHSAIVNSDKPADGVWTYKLPEYSSTLKYVFTCYEFKDTNGNYTYSSPTRAGGIESLYNANADARSARDQLDELFRTPGDTPTQITEDYIYTGSFATDYAYVLSIQSGTGNNPSWQLLNNGSGYFSNGKISFDRNGNMQIGKWEVCDDYIQASVNNEGAINLLGLHPQVALSNGNDKGIIINPILGLVGGFDHPDAEVYVNTLPNNATFRLAMDGSGFLAKGNLTWDTLGNLNVNGTINTSNGDIAGWKIYSNYIQGSYEDSRSTTYTKLYKTGGIELNRVLKSTYISSTLDINPVTGLSVYKFDDDDNEITQIALNMDGSGLLASGNLTWDTYGNLTLNGAVNANSGAIAGWKLNADSLYSNISNLPTNSENISNNTTYTTNSFYINKGSVLDGNITSPSISITTTNQRGTTPLAYYYEVNLDAQGFTIKTGNRTLPGQAAITTYLGLQEGYLANHNISWDNENNVTIKFTQGHYNITLDNQGIHYVDQEDDNNRGTLEWTALIDNVS